MGIGRMFRPFKERGAELYGDGDGGEGRDPDQELKSMRTYPVFCGGVVLVQEGPYIPDNINNHMLNGFVPP